MKIPPLIGHRGASHDAPENTLPSYRLAWQQGADGIEGDFWLTVDERLVCIHDPTTSRTAPHQPLVDVRTCTLASLRHHDVGRWKGVEFAGTPIATFDQILAEMTPEGMIYVEIKQETPRIVDVLLSGIDNSPVGLDQVILIAFSPEIVRQAKRLAPGLCCLLLYDLDEVVDPLSAEGLAKLTVELAADGVGFGNSMRVDGARVTALRRAGLQFHVWTVNTVEDALRYIGLGVDSITTDRPGYLRQALLSHVS